MKLKLERIEIENFKGFKQIGVDFGDITKISGMNETGKTSIPDAFMWVLFNKDSRGNTPGTSEFNEKPMDDNGDMIHNIDTTVELICRLDGQPFNLKRTQRENWVKKRGNAESTFQGNVSTYWINGVETKQSDFKARINEIAPEEIFRMVGSLSAFNALEWKKRRDILLSMAGFDVDSELMLRPEYRPIADECASRNIDVEDLRKVMADQRKRTNEEMKSFPIRIDEAKKALPVFDTAHQLKDAEYIVNDSIKDIEKIDSIIATAKAQDKGAGQEGQILALEGELLSLKRRVADAHYDDRKRAEQNDRTYTSALTVAKQSVVQSAIALQSMNESLRGFESKRDELRQEYTKVYESKPDQIDIEDTCPTCKQSLPAEEVEAARQKATEDFNRQKAKKLEDIKLQGRDKASLIAEYQQKIAEAQANEEKLKEEMTKAQEAKDEAAKALLAIRPDADYASDPRIEETEQQLRELKKLQAQQPDERIKRLEDQRSDVEVRLHRNRLILAKRDAGQATEKRIIQLEQQQKDAAVRVSETEQMVALIEKFIQDRCSALESGINSKFPTVQWKLFDTQINGGITDVCQCMVKCSTGLVPYGGANTASKINADIEIVNVLSEHYDVYLPLFLDNSESINKVSKTNSQLILLSVTMDRELKIIKEAS